MNLVYLFLLAFSATVSAEISIEASILNRLLQLDLGLYGTFILLDRFDDGANVTLSVRFSDSVRTQFVTDSISRRLSSSTTP